MIDVTFKQLILAGISLIVLSFNPSFNANSETLSLPNDLLNINERIESKNHSKNTDLKQSRTEKNRKMLLGNWKLPSVTEKNKESNLNITFTRNVNYKSDSSFVYKGEMKLSDNSNGKLLASANIELLGSWAVKENLLSERFKQFKVINVKSYIPDLNTNQLKKVFESGLQQETGKMRNLQITNIDSKNLVLIDKKNNRYLALKRQ